MQASRAPLENYRPEIDGLRAVAVLLVLLFHTGIDLVPGGFVGVDVFFVISGYLITKVIVDACAAQRFSYWRFLERRFFRLYPAMLATLALTLTGGFLLLSPHHFKLLGEYSASAQLSISNFAFLRNAGYFAEGAGTNPLLHTWSLAVEQQFYLVWPVLIFLAYRLRPIAVPVAVALAGLVSLIWSWYLINAAPEKAYFLAQSRVFEFAIGAFILWVPRIGQSFRAIEDLLVLTGLALILYAGFVFNKHTPFPGKMALMPCFGAALCIYAGRARVAGLLLRNPVATWIGAISYSVYLVHWPIFVLYRYYRFGPLSNVEVAAMLLAPFIVAIPIFAFVESPSRRLRFSTMRMRGGIAIASISALVFASSIYAYKDNGAPWRLDSNAAAKLADPRHFYETHFAGLGMDKELFIGDLTQAKVSLLVLGDSFAGHLVPGLNKLLQENHLKGVSFFETGCFVSPRYVTARDGRPDEACMRSSARMMELLRTLDVPVIYAQSWSGGYQWGLMEKNGPAVKFEENGDFYSFLARNIEMLAQVAGHDRTVMVVGSPPSDGSKHGLDLTACLDRPKYFASDCQERIVFNQELGQSYAENQALQAATKSMSNVVFLNTYGAFCAHGLCRAMVDDQVTYADGYHFTNFGSDFVVRHFAKEILSLTSSTSLQAGAHVRAENAATVRRTN